VTVAGERCVIKGILCVCVVIWVCPCCRADGNTRARAQTCTSLTVAATGSTPIIVVCPLDVRSGCRSMSHPLSAPRVCGWCCSMMVKRSTAPSLPLKGPVSALPAEHTFVTTFG
jgi:hypothetical protein